MDHAQRMGLDRMLIVNQIDAANADLPGLLERIREVFGKECLPINLPAGGGTRVSDCFFAPGGDSDFSSVEQAHQELIDQVVEVDEDADGIVPGEGRRVAGRAARAPGARAA